MTNEEINDLTEGYPHNVRRAIKAALYAAEEKRDPKADAKALAELGALIASGANPSPATIIAAIAGGVSLLRWGINKRKTRIRNTRGRATTAGLSAKRSSRYAAAQAQAMGAGAAWGRSRRGK